MPKLRKGHDEHGREFRLNLWLASIAASARLLRRPVV
jgi:hypothetical protein